MELPKQMCEKCGQISDNNDNSISIIKCEQWLAKKCQISDENSSELSSECSCDEMNSIATESTQDKCVTKFLDNSLIQSKPNSYGEVSVTNSKHVIIGNVTYVTGPVHLTQTTGNLQQQNIVNQIFLEGASVTQRSDKLRIISRINWLAQPALIKTPLPEPVKYVVIAHTATEEGFTQAENTLLVRLTQTFHIESRKWDDIGYNFLVGSDGHIYEGRGWGLQGAHTYGYNKKSVGIAFVGCFMDHLPPQCALNAAQSLIDYGIELGHIPEDYTLVGHCQCSPVESPGRKLYEVIKTWPRWRELTPEDRK